MPVYDVFISHSSSDKDVLVRPLAQLLKKYGRSIWLDEELIEAGDSISDAIFKGLSDSRLVILVVSPRTWTSNWSFLESGFFLAKHENCELVPLLFDISHQKFAAKFPFLADKKYYSVATDSSNLREVGKQINEYCEKLHILSDIPEPPFSLKDIIIRLNRFSIQRTSEILSFLRMYMRIKNSTSEQFLWAEKILQRIAYDCANTTDIQHFLNTFLQLTEIVKEHFQFFIRLQTTFVETACITSHQMHLMNTSLIYILDWYTQLLEPKGPLTTPRRLSVIPLGGFSKEDIQETYNIEKLVLRSDLISTWEEAYQWYCYNSLTFLGIRDQDTNKVIAFCTILPVSEEWYSAFRKGKISDTSMDLLDIRQYNLPDFYNIYISSVCVHPDYQGVSGAFTMLYNAIIEMFLELARGQEIYVYKLIAEASTLDGERLCKFIGMKEIGASNHGTRIYESYLIPPALRLKSKVGKSLTDYYSGKYTELKLLLME